MSRFNNTSEAEFLLRYSSDPRKYYSQKCKNDSNFYKKVIDTFCKDTVSYGYIDSLSRIIDKFNSNELKYLYETLEKSEFTDNSKAVFCKHLASHGMLSSFPRKLLFSFLPDIHNKYNTLGLETFREFNKIFSADELFSVKTCFCNVNLPFTNSSFQKEIDIFNLSDRSLFNIVKSIFKENMSSIEMRFIDEFKSKRSDIFADVVIYRLKLGVVEKIVTMPGGIRNALLDIIDIENCFNDKTIEDIKLYLAIS